MITYRNLGKTGRLGNQLFEIASTIGIALDRSDAAIFPADWIYRPFFSIPDIMFMDHIPESARESTEFVDYMDPRALPYLQDTNLFWRHIDTIRRYFNPSSDAIIQLFKKHFPFSPRLGIHVRRGDNVIDPGVPNKSDYHLCPGVDYYQRGLAELAPFAFSNASYVICSDDIDWCRESLPRADYYGNGVASPKENEPTYLSEVPTDWMDFFALAMCDYFIISGSTFGIWAAILSGSDIVVRPDKVYGPLLSYIDESLLFSPDWKVIPHAA